MKYTSLFTITFIIGLFACNSKQPINNENIQGTWTCFDYTISGEGINQTMETQSKQIALQTTYKFIHDTLIMKNDYFILPSTYSISADGKQMICSVIGYTNIQPRIFSIQDFTGDVLVLEEAQQGITTKTFLQRNKD
ncbi:MAG TPA: hypothetical protein P5243_03215 [Bacteroidales bacterium]|jgi:hypothetical protein|nr:hypothetical protein [Bacteroidales bacterium]HRS18491.1 hypothetical protein [Bacteroidales bacterium]